MKYLFNCQDLTILEWKSLTKDATPTDGVALRRKIRVELPHLYEELSALNFPNPYEEQCTETDRLYIYVHSAIEYFILKENK